MSEPWTPGPWTYEPPDDYDRHNLHDGLILGPGDMYLAQTSYDGLSNTKEHAELADGRLISLAPEMAELLKEWSVIYQHGEDIEPDSLAGRTLALLARARGEATDAGSPA